MCFLLIFHACVSTQYKWGTISFYILPVKKNSILLYMYFHVKYIENMIFNDYNTL